MHHRFPRRLAPFLLLLVVSLPACGVVISAGSEGTEVFKDFEVAGDFTPGSTVQVTVEVAQPYPVSLEINCAWEDTDLDDDERAVAFEERATVVYETILEANPDADPGEEESAVESTIEFEFEVDEPATYFIACFTVAAPENRIGERFTVEEA